MSTAFVGPNSKTNAVQAHVRIAAYISELVLIFIAAVFLSFHAVNLRADFPNHSPWMDWAKYTDEGWYGDAAIRHFQRGSWYVAGDFNPAAALPVWPLVESLVFRFAGVNLVAARALTVTVFGFILIVSYLLIRRWQHLSAQSTGQKTFSLAPAIAVLLLAVSPFCYAFMRMAILEPMLILLALLALLSASYASPIVQGNGSSFPRGLVWSRFIPILCVGTFLPLMILTKTTAVFLFPAVGWLLFARAGYRLRPFLQIAVPVFALAAAIWLGYYGLVVRPHFLTDYRYLFTANGYTGITRENALSVFRDTVKDGIWVGRISYPLSLLAIVVAFFFRRHLLRNPLLPALLLWIFGYVAFLAYHNNLQPRYYLVIAIPLTLLVPIVFEDLWNRTNIVAPLHHLAAACAVGALAILAVTDARQSLQYVRTPEYTFANAANRIHQIVSSDHTHNPLVLSISGSDLSLMTGLPSICDDFGTMDLAVRVSVYKPGWYVTWNQVDDDKMDALSPLYHLQRVAAFPAMDDPERNLLILYRLDPAIPTVPRRRHTRPIPRLLETTFGQQPTVTQLQH